jgi:3-oxoacyl-[acyl-carrier protein] reductase
MKDKVVLVTGGAGEIGSAICKIFADNNYAVVASYRSDEAKAQRLLNELNKINDKQHSIIKAQTTNASEVNALRDYMLSTYGKLDVLVNNAGITTPVAHDDLEGLTDEWIDNIMATNFRGSFAMVRAMKDLLIKSYDEAYDKRNSSLVVNISSIAGIYGIGSNVAYCASKAALDSMTRSLARVLAPAIRMVSVSPGFVEGEYTKNFDPSFLESQKNNTPLGRFATGEDVAKAVFALTDSLSFTNGGIVTVDGGRLLK